MTTTQLIYSDANKAYRTIVTSAELDAQFENLKKDYKLPSAPTSEDFKKQTQYALLQMINGK